MSPYRKAIAFVLRLVALGFIIVPLILFGLDYFAAQTRKSGNATGTAQRPASGSISKVLKIGSVIVGTALLFASGSIARRLTQDLDEDQPEISAEELINGDDQS
jgi:TRAP-type C4-dicarboxylate transport system permease small subunit